MSTAFIDAVRAFHAKHADQHTGSWAVEKFHADAVVALDAAAKRTKDLEDLLRAVLKDVVPHTRDTGHNAADREMRETIDAVRASIRHS